MLNKFIFSGIVEAVDEENKMIAFSMAVPNSGSILMNMNFSNDVIKKAAELHEKTNVIITIEGFVIPGKNAPLDLVVTSVTTLSIPNKIVNKA